MVWEESIIMLPDACQYAFLSATIPNAFEFAQWVANTHARRCHVVYTDFRPVPLQHYIMPCGGTKASLFCVVRATSRVDTHAWHQWQRGGSSAWRCGGRNNTRKIRPRV